MGVRRKKLLRDVVWETNWDRCGVLKKAYIICETRSKYGAACLDEKENMALCTFLTARKTHGLCARQFEKFRKDVESTGQVDPTLLSNYKSCILTERWELSDWSR